MPLFDVPDCFITTDRAEMANGAGCVLTAKFTEWYLRQEPAPLFHRIDNKMCIQIDDPVCQLSFRCLVIGGGGIYLR